ncbi:MAG: hypothetical protein ACKERG_02225 [Candidatus Hodgkinia cicadicola]
MYSAVYFGQEREGGGEKKKERGKKWRQRAPVKYPKCAFRLVQERTSSS